MLEETSLKASHHGNTRVGPRGSDEDRGEMQTCVDTNHQSGLYLQSSETCCPSRSFQLHDDLNEFSEWSSIGDVSQDVSFSLEGCVKLERRWMLWYEFKKELSCLEDWLRTAEKIAASPNSSHVLYVTAKEELQKYENLRAEARMRLTQLDGLTQKSRTLVGLFRGTMGARLVENTKDCGRRWDQLSNTVETVCRRLKHLVCQREDFERQREEMAVWLADMDLRLTEVEHFSGKDTCSKMHQLQGFQEAVGESAGKLNDLLQHGEELIQKSEPADAQAIESQLQELLLHCTRVFQGLGRLHTRLLSMRLVFEEDWALCAPDSGCPSESMLEDESFLERTMAPQSQACLPQSSQDHQVLEWDPSVDIGRSISRDDTDSSSFSAAAGVSCTDEPAKYPLRRRVYKSPVDSHPDRASVSFKQPGVEKSLERAAPAHMPVPVIRAGNPQYARQFKTSTPETRSPEPLTFDPDRISAWLGQTHQLCSKAIQTEHVSQPRSSFSSLPSGKVEEEEGVEYQGNVLPRRRPHPQQTLHTCNNACPSLSCDLQHHYYQCHEDPQRQQERLSFPDSLEDNTCTKSSRGPIKPKTSTSSLWQRGPWQLWHLRFFVILFALLLSVMICYLISVHDTSCHRSNTLTHSFHLALHYKGPPPT
ncbi:uncharacterized protein LOC143716063 [Siphateles boraxobius]|uniref:uncharacterized protein LOC143716063 n=1 Tax=Siphateles boraxobius TaxID=180520 RepID=UPI0040629587